MKVVRKSLIQGAKRAQGVAVIIDVFRAFTVTPLFFHYGAQGVIFVGKPEEAFSLQQGQPDLVLAGEVEERLIPGFDLGNSPSELIQKPDGFLDGRTVVQRTSAGVIGVLSALDSAETVILGSYVMARAISRYILSQDPLPKIVTIVAMGSRGVTRAPEDEGCADYIEHLITGSPYDHIQSLKNIAFYETAQKFIRGDREYLPREDPLICLQRNLFDFVLKAARENGVVSIRRGDIGG
jgi:2-phosphosulfolactate phosphatase